MRGARAFSLRPSAPPLCSERLRAFSFYPSTRHAPTPSQVLDVDGDGKLSFNEFVDHLKSFDYKWAQTEERIRAAELAK